MSTNSRGRAWVDVDAAALLRNAATIQASIGPGARLVPMVKADAYGLGVSEAVNALETVDPWGYGVATVDEGVELRALGVERPVVVVSPLPPGGEVRAVKAGLQIGVSSAQALDAVARAAHETGRTGTVHVEIDTGIGRAGFDWRSASEWGAALCEAMRGGGAWAGSYTHLHSADEGATTVREQWDRFRQALAELDLPEVGFVHVLNSAGTLRLPELASAAVRTGIFLYGGRAGTGLVEPAEVASVRARRAHAARAAR